MGVKLNPVGKSNASFALDELHEDALLSASVRNVDVGVFRALSVLPKGVIRTRGCNGCEWNNWGKCNYGGSHPKGICPERVKYLMSFTRSHDKKVSFSQWQRDFNIDTVDFAYRNETERLQVLDKKIEEMESDPLVDSRDLKATRHRRDMVWKNWQDLWRDLTRFEESQISRETPRKIEVTERKTFSLEDIHRVMREARENDPLIVEGEVLDGDDVA